MPVTHVNWSECALVEVDPERVGGRPVLKGTRMPVDDILANYEYGVTSAEIARQFRLSPETVRELVSFAEGHKAVAPVV